MAFDYKKEYKEFYLPPRKPQIIEIPSMNFLAVRGQGDPNEEGGAYKESIGLLYGIAYTIKMSKMGRHKIKGYFDYVVPPLEGFWSDVYKRQEFEWAVSEAEEKKEKDFSKVEFLTYEEGMCVQCMHIGPYDNEPETVRNMELYAKEQGFEPDLDSGRYHHEIYLSDVRRCKPENLKTVIRQPVRIKDAVYLI